MDSKLERIYISKPSDTPQNTIDNIISNFALTYCLKLTIQLNIPYHLSTPTSISHLAELTSTHPESLYRLLRSMSTIGIYRYDIHTKLWSNSPYSYKLLTYLQYIALNNINSFVKESAIHMTQLLQNQLSIIQLKQCSSDFFSSTYQDLHSKLIFQSAMNARTFILTRYLEGHLDLQAYSSLLDIGGGNGSVLAFFLQQTPHLKGAVYDLPLMHDLSTDYIASLNLSDRFEFIPGDFFQSIPVGYDVHILKNILHDWDDERCKTILSNCRSSLQNGLLLIIEYILDNKDNSNSRGKRDDINMMVILNSEARTESQYRSLLNAARFEIKKIQVISDIMMVIHSIPI